MRKLLDFITALLAALRNVPENRKGAKHSVFEISEEKQRWRKRVIETSEPVAFAVLKSKFELQDITMELTVHKTKMFKQRPLLGINKVIFHQAMSKGTIAGVAKYHVGPNHISKTGCPGILYQIGIEHDKDGTAYKTNRFRTLSWHTKGQNLKAIGVLVMGDFHADGWDGTQTLMPKQRDNIRRVMDLLLEDKFLPGIDSYQCFQFHSTFNKKACPGFAVYDEVMIQRQQLSEKVKYL